MPPIIQNFLDIFRDIVITLSQSDLALIVLAGSAIALLGLLFYMPKIDLDKILAADKGGIDSSAYSQRMIYQVRRMTSGDQPLRQRLSRGLFRDGNPSAPIVTDNNDFLMLMRLVMGLVFGMIAGVMVILLNADLYFLGLPIAGFLGPILIAGLYNKIRRGKIVKALPLAAIRLRTRVGAEARIVEAFSKAAENQKGPLWDEMRWAARQMADDLPFATMKDIDIRNNITFFGPLAGDLERAAKRNKDDMRNVFVNYMDRKLDADFMEKENKLAGLLTKVNTVMIPFLLFGMLAAAGSTLLVGMLNDVGGF